jgi:hypothetical protein
MNSYTSTTTAVRTTDLQIELFHDYHGDGQQQSDEPSILDLILDIQGIDTNYKTTVGSDSNGEYWARNVPVWKRYQIVPRTDKFRYIALSNAEFRSIRDYSYPVTWDEPTLRLGLMEGFLTIPISRKSDYVIDDMYDRNPDPAEFLYWNGTSGSQKQSPGSVSRGILNINHYGIDYSVKEGTPLLAEAAGIVNKVGGDERGKFVFTRHRYGFLTSSGHISKSLVSEADEVVRGQPVALSGTLNSGDYPVNHQQLLVDETILLDPYRPIFKMSPQFSGYYDFSVGGGCSTGHCDPKESGGWVSQPISPSNPNLLNYWTRDNDPQYAVT